ncbi:MAG: hypothetical protein U9N86_11665 [Bacteroidota bacterium]|nr:hypothetical protein [Bacteroidota bacterium]
MKKIERTIFIFVLLLLTLLNLFQNKKNNRIIDSTNYSINNNQSLNYIRKQELISSDHKLTKDNLLLSESGDTVSLEILASKPKMVLYISEHLCLDCIDSIFICANKTFGLIPAELIIIRSKYTKASLDIKNYSRGFETYFQVDHHGDIPLMSTDLPFFFLLDQDLLTKTVFIPGRSGMQNTMWYLARMRERLHTARTVVSH